MLESSWESTTVSTNCTKWRHFSCVFTGNINICRSPPHKCLLGKIVHCCLHSGASLAMTAFPPCFLPWGRARTWNIKLVNLTFSLLKISFLSLPQIFGWLPWPSPEAPLSDYLSPPSLYLCLAPGPDQVILNARTSFKRDILERQNLNGVGEHCRLLFRLLPFHLACCIKTLGRRRVLLVLCGAGDIVDRRGRGHHISLKGRLFSQNHLRSKAKS